MCSRTVTLYFSVQFIYIMRHGKQDTFCLSSVRIRSRSSFRYALKRFDTSRCFVRSSRSVLQLFPFMHSCSLLCIPFCKNNHYSLRSCIGFSLSHIRSLFCLFLHCLPSTYYHSYKYNSPALLHTSYFQFCRYHSGICVFWIFRNSPAL